MKQILEAIMREPALNFGNKLKEKSLISLLVLVLVGQLPELVLFLKKKTPKSKLLVVNLNKTT